jgi:hypothetical protein
VSCVPYVASFSGLSISDCSFGILYCLLSLTNTERAIRNGQSRETGNIGYTGHKSRTSNIREYRTSNQKWTIQRNWWLLVRYSLMFVVLDLCPVYPMLPVSLDCPFLIACTVFSNVCCPRLVSCVPYVASFSGLSIGNIGYTGHKLRTTNIREYTRSN